MPLKLCVSTSQKIGQPDFGSLGASCEVEIELAPSLLQDDLDAFHRHVRHAFVACRQAVTDELARHESESTGSPSPPAGPSEPRPAAGRANGNGSNGNRASDKQQNYINNLAGQIRGLGARRLEALAQKMFSKPLADLGSLDASSLIDTLRAIQGGQIKLEDALDGATT